MVERMFVCIKGYGDRIPYLLVSLESQIVTFRLYKILSNRIYIALWTSLSVIVVYKRKPNLRRRKQMPVYQPFRK